MANYRFNGVLGSDLGISNVTRTDVNQAIGTVTFLLEDRGYTADLPEGLNEGDPVTITKDGVRWFVGIADDPVRVATGSAESFQITINDPWWYLANLVYQQEWAVPIDPNNPESPTEFKLRSTVILNASATGVRIDTRSMVLFAVSYCAGAGAPIQVDASGVPVMDLPLDEMKDPLCSEIIIKQLRFFPDAVTSWDFSTTVPTLRFTRRGTAPVKTIDAATIKWMTSVSLRALRQQVAPAVVFKYEVVNTENDASWTNVVVDKYPVDAAENQFRIPMATFRLSGDATTVDTQKITASNITPDDLPWWKTKLPWLDSSINSQISAIDIIGGSVSDPDFPREITEGIVPYWKETDFKMVTVQALASYTLTEATSGAIIKKTKEPITVVVRATKLDSKTYQNRKRTAIAEQVPIGLAEQFYRSVSVLHYEGRITITGAEPRDDFFPGQVLNITNARAEWATMRAQIQTVSHQVDSGVTTLTLGRPRNLGPQDLLELLRINRGRSGSQAVTTLTTGRANQTKVEGGAGSTVTNASTSGGTSSRLRVAKDANNYVDIETSVGDTTIKINGKVLYVNALTLTKDVFLREIDWCEPGSTTPKKVLVMMSEPYSPE